MPGKWEDPEGRDNLNGWWNCRPHPYQMSFSTTIKLGLRGSILDGRRKTPEPAGSLSAVQRWRCAAGQRPYIVLSLVVHFSVVIAFFATMDGVAWALPAWFFAELLLMIWGTLLKI